MPFLTFPLAANPRRSILVNTDHIVSAEEEEAGDLRLTLSSGERPLVDLNIEVTAQLLRELGLLVIVHETEG